LTESKRLITFPNTDHRNFEVNPETLCRPPAQESWHRSYYGRSPRYLPPREIPMILGDAADLTCTFPFHLRKKRIISMYEWPASYSALMWNRTSMNWMILDWRERMK
jgi:hypothetical protein